MIDKLKKAIETFAPLADKFPTPYSFRDVKTTSPTGEIIFQKDNVEAPAFWSDLAVRITVEKYAKRINGVMEDSVKAIIERVAREVASFIAQDGLCEQYDAGVIRKILKWLLENQYFSFNSPVWFSVGVVEKPQTSACFIGYVDDDMGRVAEDGSININSISGQQYLMNSIFKGGSGYGANWSNLRAKGEPLRTGGTSSGVMSFLKGVNAYAGVLKSGGSSRRAAVMSILDIDHPEIMDFIQVKIKEEEKLKDLLATGKYGAQWDLESEALATVHYQNMNLTVSVTDEFLECLAEDGIWKTKGRVDPNFGPSYKARDLWAALCQAAYYNGDPGVRFPSIINKWNTIKNTAPITASNPCVSGDTILQMPGGGRPIKEIVDEGIQELPVYCADPKTGELQIRMGRNPRKTGENQKLYAVTYQLIGSHGREETIKVTANHGFLVPGGGRVETKDLKTGDYLTPLYGNSEENWECVVTDIQELPGLHDVYNITVDDFHTVAWGNIITWNCSEFLFSFGPVGADGQVKTAAACNLASIRLTKFLKDGNKFNWDLFDALVGFVIICQDALINHSSWPAPGFGYSARVARPLGLGFCDLGGLLLEMLLPYDSDEARILAAQITSRMTLTAYETSLELYNALSGNGFNLDEKETADYTALRDDNMDCITEILEMHRDAARKAGLFNINSQLAKRWQNLIEKSAYGKLHNMQVTLLAPTGTISFMMDASTTGVEPEMFLIKKKYFVGGQAETYVGEATFNALKTLGYDTDAFLEKQEIKPEHEKIFATAYGDNCISYEGHLRMVAAIQPHISGAISKTISLPAGSTPDDVGEAFLMAHRMGVKNVTVYVDGSKTSQPLNDGSKKENEADIAHDNPSAEHESIKTAAQALKDAIEKGEPVSSAKLGSTSPGKHKAPASSMTVTMTELQDLLNQALDHLYYDGRDELADQLKAKLDIQSLRFKRKMPADLEGIRHRFRIGGIKGYLHVDHDPETAKVIEIFCDLNKANSTLKGLVDCFCILVSMALQNGIPLKELTDKFSYQRFEPSGFTGNPQIPSATSIIDYIMRYLDLNHNDYIASRRSAGMEPGKAKKAAPIPQEEVPTSYGDNNHDDGNGENSSENQNDPYGNEVQNVANRKVSGTDTYSQESDNICQKCGAIMVRTGTCHMCPVCGNNDGGCG